MFIDFRERGRGWGETGETMMSVRNMDQWPPTNALTGDRTHNLGVCPDRRSNPQPFTIQENAPTN